MAAKRKVKRKEKPPAPLWTVVHRDDVTNLKYSPVGEWFSEAHAHELARPAAPDHNWAAIMVDDLSQYGKPGMSLAAVMEAKANHQEVVTDDEDNDGQATS